MQSKALPEHEPALPFPVPGPVGRTLLGFVVRDGRYHWSGFALWWRMFLVLLPIKFAMRYVLVLPHWRAEPELWGVPGFNMPIAGMTILTAPLLPTLMVLATYWQRRRFNAIAPRVPTPAESDAASSPRGAEA